MKMIIFPVLIILANGSDGEEIAQVDSAIAARQMFDKEPSLTREETNETLYANLNNVEALFSEETKKSNATKGIRKEGVSDGDPRELVDKEVSLFLGEVDDPTTREDNSSKVDSTDKTDIIADALVDTLARHGNSCMGGVHQSPINLFRSNFKQGNFSEFRFKNFDSTPGDTVLTNTGTSLELTINLWREEDVPTVSGGGLPGTFVFVKVNFVGLGTESVFSREGAGHTISGCVFPLEAQFILYNQKYGSIENATGREDGLAVIGAKFESWSNYIPDYLTDRTHKLTLPMEGLNPNTSRVMKPVLPLEFLLPERRDTYYRYIGSLPYEPCTEPVIWTVFRGQIRMLMKQIGIYRKLVGSNGLPLSHFGRWVQPLNNREILVQGEYWS